MTDPFLTLEGADIGYTKTLLKEVNTTLHYGEICLLIGNNGVGKTTLIKTLLGQQDLLSGTIRLNGRDFKELTTIEVARQISVVFANSPVPAHFTVFDLVALGKFIHYPYYFKLLKKDHTEVETIIETLTLTNYIHHPLSKLSDGNLQKAFIARALAQNTPMIVLDEPTTHLDEENKIMILSLLRKLAKDQQKVILFSSHDWRLAKEFSDKIWWLNGGELVSGLTEDVLLSSEKLTNPQLFTLNPAFKPPKITAPDLEKEMLYSALQKNFERDLSATEIRYSANGWNVTAGTQTATCKNVEEVLRALQGLDGDQF